MTTTQQLEPLEAATPRGPLGRREPNVDGWGVVHRPGCARPGWSCDSPARAGVHVLRCACCGAARPVSVNDG